MPEFGWEGDVEGEDEEPEEPTDTDTPDMSDEEAENGDETSTDGGTSHDTEETEESDSEPAVAVETEDEEDPFNEFGGMDIGEAKEQPERRRVMVWGPPGTGKTHNIFTARTPLAIIDTEGKSHDIASRFDHDDDEVRIWQPNDFPEAQDALEEALEWLDVWKGQFNRRGTIAVDSMSMMWEWSKSHYIQKYYIEPDTTGKYESESDVDLKSGFQSNDPDWPRIKEYHNAGFRAKMIESPYDFVWTQMAVEDYEEKIGKDLQQAPDKPHGERDNPYKANYILHIREDSSGIPIGDLEKTGTTQRTFAGLKWPTQPKMFEVISDIREAEESKGTVPPEQMTNRDVEIFKGKPSRLRGVNDE